MPRECLKNPQKYAWDTIYSNQFPAPPCDTSLVDFTTETVILVALGWRSNTCFDVNIRCMHRFGPQTVGVLFRESVPGPSCGCGAAITTPTQLVKVDRTYAQALYRNYPRTLQCGP